MCVRDDLLGALGMPFLTPLPSRSLLSSTPPPSQRVGGPSPSSVGCSRTLFDAIGSRAGDAPDTPEPSGVAALASVVGATRATKFSTAAAVSFAQSASFIGRRFTSRPPSSRTGSVSVLLGPAKSLLAAIDGGGGGDDDDDDEFLESCVHDILLSVAFTTLSISISVAIAGRSLSLSSMDIDGAV